jgi:formiminotetrahydrofolate cyclodeaminase
MTGGDWRHTVAAGPAAARAASTAAQLLGGAADAAGEGALAAQARAIGLRLDRLADEDAAALASARVALADVAGGGDPQRDFELGRLLDRAAEIPMLIAEASADAVELARELEPRALPDTAADVRAAALISAGAARAAACLVESNLGITEEDERLSRARRVVAAL